MQNNAMKEYRSWLEDPYYDSDTKEELKTIAGNTAEIEDRFGKDLEFGTGGLRGIMGVGTNRMNKYTVGMAIAVAAAIRGDDYLILAARCKAGEQIVHIRSGVVCGGAG